MVSSLSRLNQFFSALCACNNSNKLLLLIAAIHSCNCRCQNTCQAYRHENTYLKEMSSRSSRTHRMVLISWHPMISDSPIDALTNCSSTSVHQGYAVKSKSDVQFGVPNTYTFRQHRLCETELCHQCNLVWHPRASTVEFAWAWVTPHIAWTEQMGSFQVQQTADMDANINDPNLLSLFQFCWDTVMYP